MKFLLLLFLVNLSIDAFTQDTLYLKNAEVLEVEVLKIGTKEIRYKKTSYLEGPTYIVPTYRAIALKKANGELISFDLAQEEEVKVLETQLKPSSPVPPLGDYYKGYRLAASNFKPSGAFWGTYISSAVMPPVGILVGVSTSSFKPLPKNMLVPSEFQDNPVYLKGYIKRAKSQKLKQAAKGMGLGTLTFLVLLAVVGSAA